jgi:hypothetical protein
MTKSNVMPSLVKMEKEELRKLTAEVKETVAAGIQLPKEQRTTFTAVDMWKIRQNTKLASRMPRRNMLQLFIH